MGSPSNAAGMQCGEVLVFVDGRFLLDCPAAANADCSQYCAVLERCCAAKRVRIISTSTLRASKNANCWSCPAQRGGTAIRTRRLLSYICLQFAFCEAYCPEIKPAETITERRVTVTCIEAFGSFLMRWLRQVHDGYREMVRCTRTVAAPFPGVARLILAFGIKHWCVPTAPGVRSGMSRGSDHDGECAFGAQNAADGFCPWTK